MSTETVEKPVSATPEAQVPAAAAPAADAKAPAAPDATAKDTGAAADAAAAPAADGKAVKSGSLLDGEGEAPADVKAPAAGQWPDDWREKYVASKELGDKKDKDGKLLSDKLMERLKRYKSLEAAMDSGFAAQDKIRSGDYKSKLPENASAEEDAAFRRDNGLPTEAKAYETALPNHVWTEADQPMLDGLKERAFKSHMSQSQVNEMLGYYTELVDGAKQRHEEAIAAKDRADLMAVEDNLRAQLGGDYRASIQLLTRLVRDDREMFPEGMHKEIENVRFADGTRFLHHPAIANFLLTVARSKYGDGAFVTPDAKAAMLGEEEKIREVMRTDFQRYIREGMDKKLTAILERKDRGGRAA